MRKIFFIITVLLTISNTFAQSSIKDSIKANESIKFKYQALIIPTVLIGYGIIGLESNTLKDINSETNSEIQEHIDEKISIDDFSQYSTFLSVYGLNALGIAGKHNLKDRTIILTTAYLLMGSTVNILKHTSSELRPDNSSNNSFPSGHTATAFMGAEFLFQEYRDVSIWYGISGYAIAAGTGFFRINNNRHWFSDIAAGAGIGILSTKVAYWLYPSIKKHLFKKNNKNYDGIIIPKYGDKKFGFSMTVQF